MYVDWSKSTKRITSLNTVIKGMGLSNLAVCLWFTAAAVVKPTAD